MHRTSVLIPSYRRPAQLARCLRSLQQQTVFPSEVIVVWQADDEATRQACDQLGSGDWLKVIHSPQKGVVPAENLALQNASGQIILLIDDDAVAPETWIERHLRHYEDPTVGAAGGPADNYHPDGRPFPKRTAGPAGRLSWYGRMHGNMYDQAPAWRSRKPEEMDHLVGYNLSFRRAALNAFEAELKPYWQMFELDACLSIRSCGYRVLFDYGNVVEHHPTNTTYEGGRQGDLTVKIYNGAYNQAFVLAKHSRGLQAAVRLLYLMLIGSVSSPGLAASVLSCRRYGGPGRELEILGNTWRHRLQGWRAGARARTQPRRVSAPLEISPV